MRDQLTELAERSIVDGLGEFGISPTEISYAPVGFGDYHWRVVDVERRRWFVTVTDLAHKEFLGAGPVAAFTGLCRAMDTAVWLRDRAGLRFVTAPVWTANDNTVVRLADRYALTVFPLVAGRTGEFGQQLTAAEQDQVLALLAELHRCPPPDTTPVAAPDLPGRTGLEEVLHAPGAEWTGGPFASLAHRLLTEHAAPIRARLADFDRLAEQVRGRRRVVTHGEPHPGNLVFAPDGIAVVDWDTVGLAVPERDLAVLSADPDAFTRYAELTGHTPDPAGLALYRLRWNLLDVIEFAAWFRAEHARTPDTEAAWHALVETVTGLA